MNYTFEDIPISNVMVVLANGSEFTISHINGIMFREHNVVLKKVNDSITIISNNYLMLDVNTD